jgi:hypothetical protein
MYQIVFPKKLAALAFAVLLALSGAGAQAADYGRYDLTQLVQKNAPPAKGATLNLVLVDQVLSALQQHAGNYPPKFDSPSDAQRAKADATKLMGMLGAVFSAGSAPPEMLLRMGMLGTVSHNMDVPGGAAYAQTHFERLLKVDPAHAGGNFQYGTFLGNTGRAKEALPYLVKAKDKGVIPALYAIGMSHLMLGEKALALENLQAYQKALPGDAAVGKLIEAVQSGKAEVKKAGAR